MGMRIEAGMAADSTDGEFGEVADVIVDPVHRRVTHLVLQAKRRAHVPRLVPIAAVETCQDHVNLSWSTDEVLAAPLVQETDFLDSEAEPSPGTDIGVVRVLGWPSYPLTDGLGGAGWWDPGINGSGSLMTPPATYDLIPEGTAEVRGSSAVLSSDGRVVGHVGGVVVSPDHSITHLVLARGHLWAHREITIPIRSVESIETDQVRLGVPQDVVGTFPSVGSGHED